MLISFSFLQNHICFVGETSEWETLFWSTVFVVLFVVDLTVKNCHLSDQHFFSVEFHKEHWNGIRNHFDSSGGRESWTLWTCWAHADRHSDCVDLSCWLHKHCQAHLQRPRLHQICEHWSHVLVLQQKDHDWWHCGGNHCVHACWRCCALGLVVQEESHVHQVKGKWFGLLSFLLGNSSLEQAWDLACHWAHSAAFGRLGHPQSSGQETSQIELVVDLLLLVMHHWLAVCAQLRHTPVYDVAGLNIHHDWWHHSFRDSSAAICTAVYIACILQGPRRQRSIHFAKVVQYFVHHTFFLQWRHLHTVVSR